MPEQAKSPYCRRYECTMKCAYAFATPYGVTGSSGVDSVCGLPRAARRRSRWRTPDRTGSTDRPPGSPPASTSRRRLRSRPSRQDAPTTPERRTAQRGCRPPPALLRQAQSSAIPDPAGLPRPARPDPEPRRDSDSGTDPGRTSSGNRVAALEQKLRQDRTVLPSDAGDQRPLHAPILPAASE